MVLVSTYSPPQEIEYGVYADLSMVLGFSISCLLKETVGPHDSTLGPKPLGISCGIAEKYSWASWKRFRFRGLGFKDLVFEV